MEPLTDSFEKLASGLWLEGLAIDYQRNIVWYSDVVGGGVHGLMPGGSIESINLGRKWTAGLLVNEDGAVLSSGTGGILWNNCQQLYCNDTFVGTYAFDVRADFTLANKRLLLAKKDCDGMAVDGDGNLWITGFQSNHFVRLRPDGTQLASAEAPAEAITQLRRQNLGRRASCY